MSNTTKKKSKRQPRKFRSERRVRHGLPGEVVPIRQMIREALMMEISGAARNMAKQLVEDEVTRLVGEPWSRKGDSPLRRGGSCKGRMFIEGEPVHIERTRVRDTVAGGEYPLDTIAALNSRDAFDEDIMRLMAVGVSTRKYDKVLGKISDGLGLKKSAVSSAFRRASQKDLDALNGRPLGDWTFVSIFIDGKGFADHMCVVAMGITPNGDKHILGAREGASENSELVTDLLENLRERGLTLSAKALFVLDGSKALAKGVKRTFGTRALIQRCILHKERNVLSYLPPKWQAEARRRLRAAWTMTEYSEAKNALEKVELWLRGLNESAAASLREGFESTLTVHKLGVTGPLRKTLQTTNPIESAFDTVGTFSARVKRWNGAKMVMRRVGSGLTQAESSFRRVKGYRSIPELITALEATPLQDRQDVA